LISESELENRCLSMLELPADVDLADCTASQARVFGLTAEIHSADDYTPTQAWAAAFLKSGFDGVHYYLRHDPGQRCVGVALFGPAGVAKYAFAPPERISEDVLRQAQARFGLQVAPPLHLAP
jgi:hypothetical protein